MTEAALKDAAMKKLAAWFPSGFFWRQGATPYGRAGVPDILGVVDGIAVALEAKQPGRYKDPRIGMSRAQVLFADRFESAGGSYVLFDSLESLFAEFHSLLSREQRRRSGKEA